MKDYLGDGVYAQLTNHGDIVLTTENGIEATNTIILEPSVSLALVRFRERAVAKLQTQRRAIAKQNESAQLHRQDIQNCGKPVEAN